jgi:hypothetical protein
MLRLEKTVFNAVKSSLDFKNATITLKDGTGTPVTLEIKMGEGNLTFSEKKQYDYILDRGTLDDVRAGDDVPMDLSFSGKWELVYGSGQIQEFLWGVGSYSGNISTDSDTCRPYACDVEIEYAYSTECTTPGKNGTITLPDFRAESCDFDVKAGTISVSGKCNVTTATRVTS